MSDGALSPIALAGYLLLAAAVLLELYPFLTGMSAASALASVPGEMLYNGYEFNLPGVLLGVLGLAFLWLPALEVDLPAWGSS
jgi:hypothetical protein